MHFGVLGTLHILSDAGVVLAVSSAKQRLLLALLLFRANQPVSADYLLDRLWNGRPPRSARTNLQVYVYRLRQLLGEHRILHGPGGYRLTVAAGELDAIEFERLAAAGRPAEALAVWRGTPYADVTDIDELRDEAARLTERLLTTTEDWYDEELDAGRHDRLVPELLAFVEQNPLRERSRGQLMLALYRSGRAAEALDSYRAARARMIDELGIEPGPGLRRLEQRILEQDRELDAAQPAPAAEPARVAPAELPPLSTTFTGRRAEVKTVAEHLTVPPADGAVTVIAISGPGGVGKSALALQAAHPVTASYPGGQLYVDLHGSTPGAAPSAPADVLARLLRSLGVAEGQLPSGEGELAALFRSLTSAARTLVVLDNAADAAQIRPLLPGAGSALLVTSRAVPTTLDGAVHVRLDMLDNDAAVELLGRLAGRPRIDAGADELIRLCGGLPLALRITGARLAARPDWTAADLAARLADDRQRLAELEHSDLAVRPSFAISFDALSPDAACVLLHLGVLGLNTVTAPVAAAMTCRTDVRRPLDELVEAQLLQPAGDRYALHDLVRLFAREEAEHLLTPPARYQAVHRVMAHYVATARAIARLVGGDRAEWRATAGPAVDAAPAAVPDADAAADWMRAELPNVLQLAEQAATHPDGAALLGSFVASSHYVLAGLARTAERIALSRIALGACSIDQLRTFAHLELSGAFLTLGQRDASVRHGLEALNGFVAIDDLQGEATVAGWLGAVLAEDGRFEEAFTQLRRAMDIRRETGDRFGVVATANQLGLVHRNSGNLPAAEEVLHDAVLTMRELTADHDLPPRQHVLHAVLLGNLAKVYAMTDRPAEAITCLEQAAALVPGTGHDRLVAKFMWSIGDAFAQLGDHTAARSRWAEALTLARTARVISQTEADQLLASPTPTRPTALN